MEGRAESGWEMDRTEEDVWCLISVKVLIVFLSACLSV